MRKQRSAYVDDEAWDELVQWGYRQALKEVRPVSTSELVRRGIYRELEALRGKAYKLPALYPAAEG